MNKKLLSVSLLLFGLHSQAQVGIGTLTPDPSAQLDVVSDKKGILIPRVQLKSTTDTTTIEKGNVNSLLVFNINTQNDIIPGYYYWFDNKWMRIVNSGDIAALDKNTTNTSLTVMNGELVLTDSDGNTVSIPLSQINIPTTLVNNNDGTYTYTNEEGIVVTIDVPADVVNNIETILGDTSVLNELIEVLGGTYVGGNVYYNGTQFTYVDQSGITKVINIKDLVAANETLTNLVYDAATGVATYTNEAGAAQTINLSQVVKDFETLTSLSVDNTAGTLTYTDEAGNTNILDLATLIKSQETVTTLVNNNNGTYTYTSENGTVTTVNIPADIASQFNDIVNSGPVTVNGNTYTTIEQYIKDLVTANQTVTNLVYDAATGVATYTNEAGTAQTINLSQVVKDFETLTSLSVDNTAGTLTYTDEAGNTNVLDLATLIKSQETVTTLVNNNNGTYTYTSENGTVTTVNIPADIVNQFDSIVNNGPVTVDGNTYNTIEEYIEHIVSTSETLTTFVNNNNGTYTYTSENGTVTTVNIPADIASQFNDIVNSGPVTVNGNTYTTIEQYIKDLVTANQTVTNLVYDAATGVATYTNEAGTAQTINLSQVVKDFETLTSLSVDNTAGTLTYTDEAGNTNILDLATLIKSQETVTTLVNNNNGTYTYTSENGTVTTVNIPADIASQFNDIVNSGPVTVNGNTYTTIEQYIKDLVAANETVTTLVNNNNGTYTYTSENGTVTTVNIPADIASQFNDIVNSGPVTVNGNTYTTIEQYIKHIVSTSETLTTLVNNNNGTYTYTSENGAVTTVNIPADIASQFNDIVNSGPVTVNGNTYTTIEQYIKDLVTTNQTVTNLVYDATTGVATYTNEAGTAQTINLSQVVKDFETLTSLSVDNTAGTLTYTDEAGNTNVLDLATLIKSQETVTTLVNNNNGTYTYTSENGTVTTVNIPADIVNQFDSIVNNGPVTVNGNTYTTIEQYIKDLVAANETVTTLVNNNNGTYTYTSENGTVTTVNIPADIASQFNDIVNSGPVTVNGNTYTTIEQYIKHIVSTSETLTTLVNNNNGTYTYTSENGTVTTVNIPADIVNQFDSIVNNGPVTVDGNTYNTIEEYIEHIVSTSETLTTLVNNNNGTYTYTSENGTVTTVNIPADIASQFNDIVNSGPVTVNGNTYTTIEQYIKDLVTANQTVTNLVYDAATGVATYTNETGTAQTINLSQVVKDFETLTSLSVDNTAGTLTYTDEAGNTNVLDLATLIKSQETVTTLVNNNNGTYTYTSENGTVTTVNIPADIASQFNDIVNSGPVTVNGNTYTTIEQYIKDLVAANETVTNLVYDAATGVATYTNEAGTAQTINLSEVVKDFETLTSLSVDNTAGTLTYTDEAGNTNILDLATLIKSQETVTTLVNNNNGTYTYTSENGTVTTVNIPADIVNQFDSIVNSGPVTVDGNTYNTIEEYIEHIVSTSETLTTLVNNNNGTYTYTSENGTVTTVNIPADIASQFNDIVNSGPVTVNGNTYTTIEQYIKDLVTANQTVTNLVYDAATGVATYTNEAGTAQTINLSQVVKDFETLTSLSVDNTAGTLTYTDEAGNTNVLDLATLIKSQETVTTLVNNNNGTYTYTSENGTVTTVNIPADIASQFNDIVNSGPVTVNGNTYTTIEQYIKDLVTANQTVTNLVYDAATGVATYTNEAGTAQTINLSQVVKDFETLTSVSVDNTAGTLTYTDEAGNTNVLDLATLIKSQETVTTLVNNNNGTYTYTSENGTVTTVNIPADIVNQFDSIVNNGPVTVDGNTYNTIEEYIKHIVSTSETLTTLVNNNNGTYTYTSENGTVTTVNIPADIASQFNDIVNSGPVTVNGNTYTTIEQYIKDLVAANETLTNLVYDAATGVATYTNEAGTAQTINLSQVVKDFETLTSVSVDNTAGTLTYKDEAGNTNVLDLATLIKSQETVTTLVNNNNGTYTYTSENGTVTTVNIPADIVNQFNDIVNNGPVTVNGNTYTTIEQYIKDLVAANETVTNLVYDAATGVATYTNEAGTAQTINLSEVVKDFETLTSVSVDNTAGTLTYTDEAGNTNVLDLATLIKSQETVTTLVNNNNGTYTYTSENGTVTTVNIPADIVNQFDSIVNSGSVTVNGNTYTTIEQYIKDLVSANQTLTSMVQDDATGVITYTPERGTPTTAEVVSADAGNEITVGTDGGAYYKAVNTVANISTSHIVSAEDDTLLIDASGSGLTVTLPAAGDNNGRILILRKMDGSGNIITLSEQVTLANGVTFNQFNVQGTMRIQSNGTNWYKID